MDTHNFKPCNFWVKHTISSEQVFILTIVHIVSNSLEPQHIGTNIHQDYAYNFQPCSFEHFNEVRFIKTVCLWFQTTRLCRTLGLCSEPRFITCIYYITPHSFLVPYIIGKESLFIITVTLISNHKTFWDHTTLVENHNYYDSLWLWFWFLTTQLSGTIQNLLVPLFIMTVILILNIKLSWTIWHWTRPTIHYDCDFDFSHKTFWDHTTLVGTTIHYDCDFDFKHKLSGTIWQWLVPQFIITLFIISNHQTFGNHTTLVQYMYHNS